MERLDSIMQTEIYDGKALADLVTLEFLAQVLGSVVAAALILIVGFLVAGWAKRRVVALPR